MLIMFNKINDCEKTNINADKIQTIQNSNKCQPYEHAK